LFTTKDTKHVLSKAEGSTKFGKLFSDTFVPFVIFVVNKNFDRHACPRKSLKNSEEITMSIEFTPDEWYEPQRRNVVWFSAIDDEKVIQCALSIEALVERFGAFADDPLPAFRRQRELIWRIAAKLIAERRFEDDGSIFIRNADLATPADQVEAS
jgi:hypothetical protein